MDYFGIYSIFCVTTMLEFLFAWFDSRGKVAGKDEVLMHQAIAGLLKEKKGVRECTTC